MPTNSYPKVHDILTGIKGGGHRPFACVFIDQVPSYTDQLSVGISVRSEKEGNQKKDWKWKLMVKIAMGRSISAGMKYEKSWLEANERKAMLQSLIDDIYDGSQNPLRTVPNMGFLKERLIDAPQRLKLYEDELAKINVQTVFSSSISWERFMSRLLRKVPNSLLLVDSSVPMGLDPVDWVSKLLDPLVQDGRLFLAGVISKEHYQQSVLIKMQQEKENER